MSENLLSLSLAVLCGLSIVYLFSGLDDLFIDLYSVIHRLGPKPIPPAEWNQVEALPEKRIAVLVPAWRESHIISRMLLGNLDQIRYSNLHFFVGVYPNDPDTVNEVIEVEAANPRVHAVVNALEGPTSKGQILNEVLGQILAHEARTGETFDAFLLHDAEDVIHPDSIRLINRELNEADFVQVPVYSFPVPIKALVAGTYMGEFAESHTKDLLVREHLGAAIPSAGVGTCLSRRLVLAVMGEQGKLLRDGALTEDYELGIHAHRLGFRPTVACRYFVREGKRDYIATREYFPRRLSRSIRQKTRWTMGINLLAWSELGWPGTFANRYFLARDRKGLFTAAATLLGYAALAVAFALGSSARVPEKMRPLFAFALFFMGYRALWRAYCLGRVYGPALVPAVPFQMVVGNFVHGVASYHAVKTRVLAAFGAAKIRWIKTEHELPVHFGRPVPAEAKA